MNRFNQGMSMNILPEYIEALPVRAIADRVNRSLSKNPRLIVTAPPGSGKSTLLPLTIADEVEGRVIILEPRRAAARQIAMRMAFMLGEKVGKTVGYRMRFESKISSDTRIEVVTEGVMERMLVEDPTLEGISAVIFDEFHERSVTSDLTLTLTLESQNIIREDLRVVIMSATIDTKGLSELINAPVLTASGQLHDVDIFNCDDADIRDCVPAAVSGIRRAYREQPGNILVFLPGQAEIVSCSERIAELFPEAKVFPLHGMLSTEEQNRAIEYNPQEGRKIILATPIAETSLTIEGVKAVVDTGLYRTVRYDTRTGLSRLITDRISMDMARQRAGRAGRLSDGVCYRLWSKATELRMAENRVPEIVDADLSPLLLKIAAWGTANAEKLPWVTPPDKGHLIEANRLLRNLEAINDKGEITAKGRKLSLLPCHPRVGSMLTASENSRMKSLATDIAAILEEKDPLTDADDVDINTRLDILRRRRRDNTFGSWKRIIKIAEQYRRMIHAHEDNSMVNNSETGRLLAYAYPERIAVRINESTYRLSSGENVRISEKDNLNFHEYLAVASMDKRVFLASPIERSDLRDFATEFDNISWNSREGRLIARKELRIGILVIDSRNIDNLDVTKAAVIIAEAARKEGQSMFNFNDDVSSLMRRIETVRGWHPEMIIPEVSYSSLMAEATEWLPMYLGKATTVQELRKIDMCKVIEGKLGYAVMQDIDRLAPTNLRLPSGRNARISYRAGNPVPIVSARIEDFFGVFDTPRLDNGKRPVLVELLSPGFKPVQITQDLRGFWSTTYFEVRKELRRRYPKHKWPDNPFDAEPSKR